MPTYLDQIMAATLLRVDDRKARPACRRWSGARPRTCRGALPPRLRTAATKGPAMIAECKKASPSVGCCARIIGRR